MCCSGLVVLRSLILEGTLFAWLFPRVKSSGVARCFLVDSSSELWKWHRKLGHLSFDFLSCLSRLNLV
jgi:hypothetical protein